MRFFACIQPFICRSKSSRRRRSCHLPALDDAQRASWSPPPVSIVSSEKNGADNGKVEVFPAGILKKSGGLGSKEAGKGRVKWMDYLGKELVEIREFEPIAKTKGAQPKDVLLEDNILTFGFFYDPANQENQRRVLKETDSFVV